MENVTIKHTEVAYSTPWFDIVAKTTSQDDRPFYSLATLDYVSVVALTVDGDMLFVRQYRPAVEQVTLELPSGHVDPGESPETSARKELLEETGYNAQTLYHLGTLAPDTGRLGNRLWCYLALNATQTTDKIETGLDLFRCSRQHVHELIITSRIHHALHLAVLMLANAKLDYSLFKGPLPDISVMMAEQ
jgi:ADP-ribose pyrophosphatase